MRCSLVSSISLSYSDVVDLLEERGIAVDRSTVYRWV